MVKTIEIEKIKFKELAAAIKVLNDSGKMDPKIPTVAKSKDELVQLFVDGVQAIPDDANGDWTGPAPAAVYYQKITIAEEVSVPPKAEKAIKEPKALKEKKEKVVKEPKEKVPGKKSRLEVTGESLKGQLEDDDSIPVSDAVAAADKAYALETGKANEKEAKWAMNVTLSVLKGFGTITVADGIILKA